MASLKTLIQKSRAERIEMLLKAREGHLRVTEMKQAAGLWEDADRYHEAAIAPLNDELERMGVW